MRALQHVERLLEVAGIGERAPVGAEQGRIAGIVDRGGFQHGGRLGALAGRAQRLRVADGVVGIARIGAELLAASASLSRRQSASLRVAGLDEIEPVVSTEPVVLQPASGAGHQHGERASGEAIGRDGTSNAYKS